MPRRIKWKFMPDIPLPGPAAIRDTIGDRIMQRTKIAIKNDSEAKEWEDPEYFPAGHDDATLVTSELPNGNHMPVIDLDLTTMLIPSTRPGHYHLYVNREMSWGQFLNMLQAMTDAGVVQDGFNRHTRRRGHATVRYPGVTKENEAERIAEVTGKIEQIKQETRQQLREDGIIG